LRIVSGNDIAFVGALAALGAAVATPTAAWLMARLQARTAREEREHAGSLDAYDDAMTLAYHVQASVVMMLNEAEGQTIDPALRFDMPSSSEMLAAAGRVEVRGSNEAAEALQAVALAGQEFALKLSKVQASGRWDDATRKPLYDARDLVTERRRDLGRAIREDTRRR
jgi:hypothetical protein